MEKTIEIQLAEHGERIAKAIEATCDNPDADSYRAGCWEYQEDSFGVICTHIEDAAIARTTK